MLFLIHHCDRYNLQSDIPLSTSLYDEYADLTKKNKSYPNHKSVSVSNNDDDLVDDGLSVVVDDDDDIFIDM